MAPSVELALHRGRTVARFCCMSDGARKHYRIFIQARMNSQRFPGKMLADFRGRPLIGQILSRFASIDEAERCVVLTSVEETDDPLAEYVASLGSVSLFRGPLDDVFQRFRLCLDAYPCDWMVRVSGDSPLLDPQLPATMMKLASQDVDLVTNVARRTFPPGQSVECIRARCFGDIDESTLTASQREHVTGAFYEPSRGFRLRRIMSLLSDAPDMTIDEPDDLPRVAALADSPWGAAGRFASFATAEA
jgi:spore coat polysaccharide biosynthesis protein SpsF